MKITTALAVVAIVVLTVASTALNGWGWLSTTAGLAVILTFGGTQTVSFTARVPSDKITAPHDNQARQSFTLASTGNITVSDANNDAGLAALITAWETANASASVLAKFAPNVVGETQWAGNVYVSRLQIGLPWAQAVTVSGSLEGAASLTRSLIT